MLGSSCRAGACVGAGECDEGGVSGVSSDDEKGDGDDVHGVVSGWSEVGGIP